MVSLVKGGPSGCTLGFVDIKWRVALYYKEAILGGAATCSEGFVICFLQVPLACLGSTAAAVQPNSNGKLSEKSKKKLLNKWPPHPVL